MAATEEQAAKPASADEGREQIALQSSLLNGAEAPSRVLIAPWGEVRSANGIFVVDEQSAARVVEAYRAHGTDIPIDYEHQSLGGAYAAPTGQAPAAGWIRALEAISPDEADEAGAGLFADVEWTESGRQRLVAREYRYLSPVVLVHKRDRRVVALHSAALTNKPAIPGLRPIVNREQTAPATGTSEDTAPPAEQPNEPEPAPTGVDQAVELLRLRLGLEAGSKVETVLLAAEDQLASFAREAAEREAGDRVAVALNAGKLIPAQREWAMSLALKDPESFDQWVSSAPTVVVTGRTTAPAHGAKPGAHNRSAVIASARAAFRSEPALARLTSESAWIANALRESGLETQASP